MSFLWETTSGIAKRQLFSQANRSPVGGSLIKKFLWGVCNLRRLLKLLPCSLGAKSTMCSVFFQLKFEIAYFTSKACIFTSIVNAFCLSKVQVGNMVLSFYVFV